MAVRRRNGAAGDDLLDGHDLAGPANRQL